MTINWVLNKAWMEWCRKGKYGVGKKHDAAKKSLSNNEVRGYYSDIVLNPDLDDKNSMYPSIDHLYPSDESELVVEARIFNDMKTHLTPDEFWQAIEHLYAVGVRKGKIAKRTPKELGSDWAPENDYVKR
ncbi:MAG: hypothetical protein BWY65_01860 [Firmicutes bacterium ADurb.Bin373]|nr:MAG: hypothetical protein BWY65_01860 [Firmicutes bacterium ADurb.Bin373]